MKQCWISSVGNSFGFLESETICPSLVSPGVECRLNDIKAKILRTKLGHSRVSFTIKCSAICPISHPHILVLITWSDLLHHPAKTNGITAQEEVAVGHWCVFLSSLDSVARILLRSILLTRLLLRTLSACPWEVQRKVTCQRTWYQTTVVILYKQSSPKQNESIVCAVWRGPPCQEETSILKGIILKLTCG